MPMTVRVPVERLSESLLVVLTLASFACGAPPDRSAPNEMVASRLTDPGALSPDQIDFSSGTCDNAQQDRIKQALAVLHTQFVTNPQPMIDCLKDAIVTGPFVDQVAKGNHAEWVVEKITRTVPPIPIGCGTCTGRLSEEACWKGPLDGIGIVTESIAKPIEYLAALLGHEIAHHFGIGEAWPYTSEYNYSVSMQIKTCSLQISGGVTSPKPIDSLSKFYSEVALQTVGDASGVAAYTLSADRDYRTVCPGRLFAWGLSGSTASDGVRTIGMTCLDPKMASTYGPAPTVGDPSDSTPFQQMCQFGSNEVLVGLWGEGGVMVNSVGPVCAKASDVQAGSLEHVRYDTTHGAPNAQDPTWKRVCPAGMAVRSIRGHFGVAANGTTRKINTIQVVCQKLSSPSLLDTIYEGGSGSPHPATTPHTSMECSGRGALMRLNVNWDHDQEITRLSGHCQNFGGDGNILSPSNELYPLPGIGALGSEQETGLPPPDSQCSGTDVLVGMDVNLNYDAPAPYRGFRGICANPRKWATAQKTTDVTTTPLPAMGPADGSLWLQHLCPAGHLMAGFRIRGQYKIDDVQIMCRRFGNVLPDAERVMILIDQTGTMCNDQVPCAPAVGSFWLNALDDAKQWVQEDSSSATSPGSTAQRYYAIWTFKDTQDGTQNGAAQLWPTEAFNTGCNDTHAGIDAASGFCKFAPNDSSAYSSLQSVLEGIKTKAGQVPQPTWLTPLADSLCRSLSRVWASGGGQGKTTLILESDGGENDSLLACSGVQSTSAIKTAADVSAARAAGTPDWGFTLDSWQAKVLRRGVRLPLSCDLNSCNPFPFDAIEQAAVSRGPLTATENLPNQLTMKVGVQYALCAPGSTDQACLSDLSVQALEAAPNAGLRTDGKSRVSAAPMLEASGTMGLAASTSTTTKIPSIAAGDLGVFRAMGGLTTKGKVREIVRDPSVVFGTKHRIAGDVDDSGCVDRADLSIVMQKDIWMQRAVRPLELAIRADLDRDGWVNEHDRAVVLANWGKGCINPVGPPPSF